MKILGSLLVLLSLTGCGIFVPVINVATVKPETMQQAHGIKVLEAQSASSHPEISETLGSITAYSCRAMLTDPPPSKGDALIQLRLHAAAMGADGIKEVAYESRTKLALCLNCWETVQASGVAVKFKK
jgi:uncharacterized protein YbjQ (UPF0145 family)